MTKFQVHCSQASLHFACNELGDPRAICFPERYLGENYKKVLAFWFRLDSFTEDQWDTVIQRRNQTPDWDWWEKCDRDLIERDDEEDKKDEEMVNSLGISVFELKNSRGIEQFYIPAEPQHGCFTSQAYSSAFEVYYVQRESAAATLEIIHGVENPVFLPLFEGLLAPPETESIIEEFLFSN